MPQPFGSITIHERENLFGKILRDELYYPNLEEQFKAYNRYLLYQSLSQNTDNIYLGGGDDDDYAAFYSNQSNGSIGSFDAIETMIAEGNIEQAQVINNLIQDKKLIDENQITANNIYFSTFARDKFEFTDLEYASLYNIATNYTPWEGGEGVYIARYMLDIENNLSNPNVQFLKGIGLNKISKMLTVYPNPVSNSLCLSFDTAIEGGYSINVYNYNGIKVYSAYVNQTEAQHFLNTSNLNNGIYFVVVNTQTNTYNTKFTVLK